MLSMRCCRLTFVQSGGTGTHGGVHTPGYARCAGARMAPAFSRTVLSNSVLRGGLSCFKRSLWVELRN